MAVIYINDLFRSNNSTTKYILSDVTDISNNLIEKLNSIIGEAQGHMSSDVLNLMMSRMSLFSDALNKQVKMCSITNNNVECANNTMINYMDSYEKIDDSEKTNILSSLNI